MQINQLCYFLQEVRYCEAVKKLEFDRQLGPYALNHFGEWKHLSNYITEKIIARIGKGLLLTCGTYIQVCISLFVEIFCLCGQPNVSISFVINFLRVCLNWLVLKRVSFVRTPWKYKKSQVILFMYILTWGMDMHKPQTYCHVLHQQNQEQRYLSVFLLSLYLASRRHLLKYKPWYLFILFE